MKKILISVTALILLCLNVSAQEKTRKELKGDKYSYSYSFDKAIVSYTHSKQLSTEGQRRLAEAYHNIGLNKESESAYFTLISTFQNLIPEDYFNYAMVLKMNGKYEEAMKWMDKFAELKPNDLRAVDYKTNKNAIMVLLKDNGKYKINKLSVNTAADDFGPCYYKDKIVFASTKSHKKMVVRNYNWTGKPFWDVYISETDNGQLKKSKRLNKMLNGKLHDGPASFSNNGDFIAYTRNDYNTKRKDKVVQLQIYFSTYKNKKWSKPEPFILNNKDYSVGQPCLTDNGNTMYFTSDMPGGFGGADLYRISKNNQGKWGNAENLGNKINTEGDEMFPFYEEKSGTLFFTSNGHFGLGGLDIFISKYDGLAFGNAYNAGSPLNSAYDDYSVIVNDKMTQGYLASNRSNGSGGDDIYSFDLLKVNDNKNYKILFSVNSPKNILVERKVKESFPLRNYVFFDIGSTKIPERYVLLKKEQVKDFKEDNVSLYTPKDMTGRSKRQMTVYYNILNILGDRMLKDPTTKVRLAGSSTEGNDIGLSMAESVKLYLVNIFAIDSSRIKTEGRLKPRIQSGQTGDTKDLDLRQACDNRVTIWSESPSIMMEFMSGPDAPLKPVVINTLQEAPLDSYVSFDVKVDDGMIPVWKLEVEDMKGNVQYFGPFNDGNVSIPGKTILGNLAEGNYKMTMIGQTKNGNIIMKDTTVHMVLWNPSIIDEGMRFSVIYEFDNAKAISIYEKYLTNIVLPKIPANATIILHGYTDIIGDYSYNKKLSLERANDVKSIMTNELSKLGRNDVKFEIYGFGEDEKLAQFENKYPEELFYNRTVIIDVIPNKDISER